MLKVFLTCLSVSVLSASLTIHSEETVEQSIVCEQESIICEQDADFSTTEEKNEISSFDVSSQDNNLSADDSEEGNPEDDEYLNLKRLA